MVWVRLSELDGWCSHVTRVTLAILSVMSFTFLYRLYRSAVCEPRGPPPAPRTQQWYHGLVLGLIFEYTGTLVKILVKKLRAGRRRPGNNDAEQTP